MLARVGDKVELDLERVVYVDDELKLEEVVCIDDELELEAVVCVDNIPVEGIVVPITGVEEVKVD